MEIIADLQVHSKYARAVSKFMELPFMHQWAIRKSINLLGTGDWQHPRWLEHIKDNLIEVDTGIFEMKRESSEQTTNNSLNSVKPKFLLQSEVSCIYKQGGKGFHCSGQYFTRSRQEYTDVFVWVFVLKTFKTNIPNN